MNFLMVVLGQILLLASCSSESNTQTKPLFPNQLSKNEGSAVGKQSLDENGNIITNADPSSEQNIDVNDGDDSAKDPDPVPEEKLKGDPVPQNCDSGTGSFTANGQNRTLRYVKPTSEKDKRLGVVLFHGNGDTASNFCASTGACQHFASKGFFVAVPDGRRRNVTALGQTINNIAWDGYNLTPETNEDLALFDLIASDFKSRCQVDEIYVVGHSQGGYLAATLAMIRSQDLFGVGVAAASEALPGYSWQPQKKTPVVFVIGTADYGYNSADNFFKKLQSQGYATDFHPIQGLNHGPFPRGAEATMSAFFEANR